MVGLTSVVKEDLYLQISLELGFPRAGIEAYTSFQALIYQSLGKCVLHKTTNLIMETEFS